MEGQGGEEHADLNNQLRQRGLLSKTARWSGVNAIGNTNTKHKFFVWRRCGKHVLYRTKGAITLKPGSLECPVCSGIQVYKKAGRNIRPVGVAECRLWKMLENKFPGCVWSLQDRVGNWKGGVDACVYFPLAHFLAIQVDGVTHGRKLMSDKKNQAAKDDEFGQVAKRAGYRVLRLDEVHGDEVWEAALERAITACAEVGPIP